LTISPFGIIASGVVLANNHAPVDRFALTLAAYGGIAFLAVRWYRFVLLMILGTLLLITLLDYQSVERVIVWTLSGLSVTCLAWWFGVRSRQAAPLLDRPVRRDGAGFWPSVIWTAAVVSGLARGLIWPGSADAGSEDIPGVLVTAAVFTVVPIYGLLLARRAIRDRKEHQEDRQIGRAPD